MKNINIQMSDETYWKLRDLKSSYKAEKWSELIEMLLDVIQAIEKEKPLKSDLKPQTKGGKVPERKSSE